MPLLLTPDPIVIETNRQACSNVDEADQSIIILHSDRGSQYTSHEYHRHIEKYNILASMSKPGTLIDNAPIESSFSILKSERLPDPRNMTIEEIAKEAA